jgi:hypothetical protein
LTDDATRAHRRTSSAVRLLTRDGERWVVQEFAAPEYDRRIGPSLMFASSTIMRRVRNYPENWDTLSDDELFALSNNV